MLTTPVSCFLVPTPQCQVAPLHARPYHPFRLNPHNGANTGGVRQSSDRPVRVPVDSGGEGRNLQGVQRGERMRAGLINNKSSSSRPTAATLSTIYLHRPTMKAPEDIVLSILPPYLPMDAEIIVRWLPTISFISRRVGPVVVVVATGIRPLSPADHRRGGLMRHCSTWRGYCHRQLGWNGGPTR